MVQTFNLYESKLQEAAEALSTGQKKKARLLIRDVLALDEDNLAAWELLFRASYTSREQMICLNQILRLQPDHPWARQQLAFVKAVGISGDEWKKPNQNPNSLDTPVNTSTKGQRKGKRQQEPMLIWATIMVGLLGVFCIATWALAALRIGILPTFSTNGTATALAVSQANCQALIKQAMQASGQYCNQIGPNRACYGNNTVKAELVPDTGESFSKRGDIINIIQLQRLSASPLNTNNNEWGVAIFQIQANLPRSLPGEMVKMVVFGNTNIKNNGGNLQSFYFSSELGQLVCEKLPYDGLMVTMPNRTGIKFSVNGAEMILMGIASFKATKNDIMQVSLFNGSARISSAGQEQYFGPGQKVLLRLGGQDGTEAIGGPSLPQPLSPQEYSVACTLTGSYCSQSEISPLSLEQIKTQILAALGATPAPSRTPTNTASPTAIISPIPSLTSIPSLTPIRTATFTPTQALLPASPTRTPRPKKPTPTDTLPPQVSVTPGPPLPTPTNTSVPTITLTASQVFTPTLTNTPLPTTTPPTVAACADVTTNGLTNAGSELDMNISNNHGSPINISSLHLTWVKQTSSQKLAKIFLNGDTIWNTSDPAPASDIPLEGDWRAGAVLTIPDATTWPFAAQFQNPLGAGDYSVSIVLDIGCQIQGSITVP